MIELMGSIRLYTRSWCEDSHAAREFLIRHGLDFEEIDIEASPQAMAYVESVNEGKRRTPTFEVEGRSFHVSPFDARKLARELKLKL